MNTNKTESIRFFWNGIKVNGGKLIRCYYFTDSRSDSVTISARDYDHLPRDLFTVKNETDLYTDYFDSDSATLTPAHPLYKYARAAALKSAMRGEPEYIAKLEQDEQDAQQPGRYHWRKPEDIRAEIDRRQAQLDRNAAELATLPKGHPTAADVEAVHEMNTAAESARLAREHAEQLERREKAIRTRNENRAFIEQTAAAHPIKDGAPVVTVEWSENGAFDDGMKFSVAAAEIIFKTLDEKISAALEHGCTFQHYATDIYETAYNWTAQQYRDYLNSKRGDINAALLEAFKTPRRNLYKFDYNALPVVISKFHVQRLDGQNGHCTGDITEQVIREMFTALVNTGKIDRGETKNGAAYRTAPRRRT